MSTGWEEGGNVDHKFDIIVPWIFLLSDLVDMSALLKNWVTFVSLMIKLKLTW